MGRLSPLAQARSMSGTSQLIIFMLEIGMIANLLQVMNVPLA
jgi:hypothetical protein